MHNSPRPRSYTDSLYPHLLIPSSVTPPPSKPACLTPPPSSVWTSGWAPRSHGEVRPFLPPSLNVNFSVGECCSSRTACWPSHAMACELQACTRGCAFSLYAAGLGFRVEGLSFKVWGLEFRVSGLWALVGFRVAAFRNNAPQPGRGGRREAFKIRCIQNKYTQHLQTCVCVCVYIYTHMYRHFCLFRVCVCVSCVVPSKNNLVSNIYSGVAMVSLSYCVNTGSKYTFFTLRQSLRGLYQILSLTPSKIEAFRHTRRAKRCH